MLEADKAVLAKFPRLANPPVQPKDPTYSQYRLYRSILPFPLLEKGDRSLTFVGYLQGAAICIIGDVSSLWAVAWMTGKLDIEREMAEMEKECDLLNAFIKRRYLNAAREIPYFPFEWSTVSCIPLLLRTSADVDSDPQLYAGRAQGLVTRV